MDRITEKVRGFLDGCPDILGRPVFFGKRINDVPEGGIVFFPIKENVLNCGISALIGIRGKDTAIENVDISHLEKNARHIIGAGYMVCRDNHYPLEEAYLGGADHVQTFLEEIRSLRTDQKFVDIFKNEEKRSALETLSEQIAAFVENETGELDRHMGYIDPETYDKISVRLGFLKDISWSLRNELLHNIGCVKELLAEFPSASETRVILYRRINAVLNSLDRLEVRGRDSAGISIMIVLSLEDGKRFQDALQDEGLVESFNQRGSSNVLTNMGIGFREFEFKDNGRSEKAMAITTNYKIAAEIGSLGDNIAFIREQIKNDQILRQVSVFPHLRQTILSHTRWASVGAISEPNCHPVDNRCFRENVPETDPESCNIYVCLNGDIDNYYELKAECEKEGIRIPDDITTDTKIIPIMVEKYVREGHEPIEAFRLAVKRFAGSHAIAMHTDLDPGRVFLAQKGSGQALFIGLGTDSFMPTSEVYGFVEETNRYLKLDGEKVVDGKEGPTQGQIFVLDQNDNGAVDSIPAMFYDGTPISVSEDSVKTTEITSRDIDRQNFPHYFLKEISEAPGSVEKTLRNRWKIDPESRIYKININESVVPKSIEADLAAGKIRRLYFVGQGTAGVAAQACANIFSTYIDDPDIQIRSLKASELSGFFLKDADHGNQMADTLVIAISQSGTTTDTNRTVDMVRERGARTVAIVNRRDSDITFKVDGVLYTSSGRDIEMSVASTKAFYSQIVAGAILGLFCAKVMRKRNDTFISDEIRQLLALPGHMRKILSMKTGIEASARKLCPTKTYWAAVGSGPNKSSADEIRIKLSELCYKTISSDYIEDKKHIDLSAEPLIMVCAAGTRGNVLGDIVKDTAIFHAHKAAPVVIADEGETRFNPYAKDVFHVPVVAEHFAPIVNTLVGHLWGYYAALAINEGSRFLHEFREETRKEVEESSKKGIDAYELILRKSFREKIAAFYNEFRKRRTREYYPTTIALASDLVLLLKYLSGKLPLSDFQLDFGKKGTAVNMLDSFFEYMSESINQMARPVDAIKHQAKTVTVGTSRISEKIEGILFEYIEKHGVSTSQITTNNIIVLKNIQKIVEGIPGSIFYRIGGLTLLGELTDKSTIEIIRKEGVLEPIPSRVETDNELKGTKRIIVRRGNVYIGKGRKDDRSILVIPINSASPETPNLIEYLLLLNITFRENIPKEDKIRALGGKYEHIMNIVQENSISWDDAYLDLIETDELFGRSAEKIGERIVSFGPRF